MPKKKYKPIPLTGASKILRAHSTQIQPPGLYEMRDLYLSRSDNSMGLRSDWEPAYAGMFSYGSLIQGSDIEDYLNAAFYVDRAGHTIWFGRWTPFTWDGGAFGQLFTIYDAGTIATDSVKSEVIGSGTSWLQQVWPGCLIRQKGDGNDLYVVRYVTSDSRIVTNEVMPGLSGAEYEIFRVHPSNRAEWPIKMESLGGFLIYGTVDINQPLEDRYISGPFYSNIGRPNLGVWFGTEPDLDIIVSMASISVGYDMNTYGGLQHSRLKYFPPIVIGGNLGSVFARNWFGEDLSISENNTVAGKRETYSVSSATRDGITHIRAQQTTVEILTLAGEIILLDTDVDNLGGYARQYRYAPAGEIGSKLQPFGQVGLFGKIGNSLYLGEGGLIGESDGTTYASGVDVTLRAGVSFQDDFVGVAGTVAVGDADPTDGVILHSVPGSITRATTGVSESFLAVTYSVYLDRVIAVGTNGVCMTSDDKGATWDARSVGTTVDLNGVVSDTQGRCICIVGGADYGSGEAYLSLDGISWELVTGLGSDELIDVTFDEMDGAFYALSAGGAVYRIRRRVRIIPGSTDLGSFGTASDFVCDIQYEGAQFVAVGSKIWTSPDAITWTERQVPSATLTSVAQDPVDGTIWVAVGLGGLIYRSTDSAATWSVVSSGVTVDLLGVIYHYTQGFAGEFLIVGKEGTVLRSATGTGWTKMSFPVTSDLWAVATDHTNATANQKTLYISAGDGLVYVSKKPPTNPYDSWEAWEDRPEKSYNDMEGRTPTADHAMRSFRPEVQTSMVGIQFLGPARLVGAAHGKTNTFEELDSGGGGGIVYTMLDYIDENLIPFGDITKWHPRAGPAVANSLALAGNGNFSPVIMQRLLVEWGTINGVYVPPRDAFITSTDFGITWSTIPFSQYKIGDDTPYGLPQHMSQKMTKAVSIAGRFWAPLCTDGVDFFAVQSSNQLSVKPRTVALSTFEIDWNVEEIG